MPRTQSAAQVLRFLAVTLSAMVAWDGLALALSGSAEAEVPTGSFLAQEPVPPRAKPGPEILVDTAKAQFQTPLLLQGAQVSHRFEFKSGGAAPLVIERVIPNCGCAAAALATRSEGADDLEPYVTGAPIPPGTEIVLDVSVDTLLKQDRSKITVQLLTNASELPTSFLLVVDVEPRLRATPAGLIFGDLRVDEHRAGEVSIISTTGKPVRFSLDKAATRPLPSGFSYKLEPVRPNAEGRSTHWKLRVQVGPGMDQGPGGYRFLLVSDVPMPETVTLRKRREAAKTRGRALGPSSQYFCVNVLTNYRVLRDLEISPGVVSFGQMRAGQTLMQRVKLVATKPGIDLSKARAYIRGTLGLTVPLEVQLSVKTQPVEGENALWANVKITDVPAGFSGSIRCELAFDTGYEEMPLLRVPITGVVL